MSECMCINLCLCSLTERLVCNHNTWCPTSMFTLPALQKSALKPLFFPSPLLSIFWFLVSPQSFSSVLSSVLSFFSVLSFPESYSLLSPLSLLFLGLFSPLSSSFLRHVNRLNSFSKFSPLSFLQSSTPLFPPLSPLLLSVLFFVPFSVCCYSFFVLTL